jgi:hypothetical protein
MDFRSLQHVQISAIAFLCLEIPNLRAHPPAGFVYPLDGFIPPKPGRFCFTPAALLGFALRSFPLSLRCSVRFRPSGPTCQLFVRFTTPHKAARPARTTVASGLRPVRESLAAVVLLARQPPAAPLGFSLPRLAGDQTRRASPTSSHVLVAIRLGRAGWHLRVLFLAAWPDPEPYARHGWVEQPS